MSFCSAQSVFDCVDTFVSETGYFNIGSYFGRLWCQALGDVGLELILDDG